MGFFSTATSPSVEPQLLVSPRWWWYLVLAMPMTVLTALSLYSIVALETLKERTRKPLRSIETDVKDAGTTGSRSVTIQLFGAAGDSVCQSHNAYL